MKLNFQLQITNWFHCLAWKKFVTKRKLFVGRAFTLVELLIYMGLLSIFLLTLSSVLVSVLQVRAESASTSSVEEDGRFILSRLNYDISRASSIATPSTIGSTTNNLVLVISGNYTYALNSGNLQMTDSVGTVNLNSSESTVSGLSFQRLGNSGGKNSIKVNFTVSSKTIRAGGPETRVFSTTFGTR